MDNQKDMTWIKIDRDENGFATEECLEKIEAILKQEGDILLIVTMYGCSHYETIDHRFYYKMKSKIIREEMAYTHYLPIPKLEV